MMIDIVKLAADGDRIAAETVTSAPEFAPKPTRPP